MFERTLLGLDIASGTAKISGNFSSSGLPNATHTESFVPLPSTSSSAVTSSSSAVATQAAQSKKPI